LPTRDARLRVNAETLAWQSRIRIAVVSVAVFAVLAMYAIGAPLALGGTATVVLLGAAGLYAAIAVLTARLARMRGELPDWMVSLAAASDVMIVFALALTVSSPPYYTRVLIFAFFALSLTTFYFGRRQAITVFLLTIVAYVALVYFSIAAGAPLVWREEIWSLGFFVMAATVLLVEHSSFGGRLARIVKLFERAEEGDFTAAYEEDADKRPDAVTQVGRAYNRVRKQLASLVLTDPLTGCVNRRGFDQSLAREVARTARAGSELALLALDVDHFKSVNDTLGHLAGDAVLAEIGAVLLRTAREGDVVARTGGEEFSFILPDTSASGAFQLASRLCDALRTHAFADGARGVRLTVSIGVAAVDATNAGSAREVAERLKGRADEALYAAKRGGRDRVRAWADSPASVSVV